MSCGSFDSVSISIVSSSAYLKSGAPAYGVRLLPAESNTTGAGP